MSKKDENVDTSNAVASTAIPGPTTDQRLTLLEQRVTLLEGRLNKAMNDLPPPAPGSKTQ